MQLCTSGILTEASMLHTQTHKTQFLARSMIEVHLGNCRELQGELSEAEAQVKVTAPPSALLLDLCPALLSCCQRV